MSNEYDRIIRKAQHSLESAVFLMERGISHADYAKHAYSSAVAAKRVADTDTARWTAEKIEDLAADLMLPAYMRKHFTANA